MPASCLHEELALWRPPIIEPEARCELRGLTATLTATGPELPDRARMAGGIWAGYMKPMFSEDKTKSVDSLVTFAEGQDVLSGLLFMLLSIHRKTIRR